MTRLLLVEDDRQIVQYLRPMLEREGFEAHVAVSQAQALEALRDGKYDLLLLDVSLPDGNGYAVCRAVREQSDTPVIFLTASGDEYSVVSGFEAGADDYISKPFRPRELISRIRSVLRRTGKTVGVLTCGSLSVDTVRGTVTRGGAELSLSALEYRLLLTFLSHKGMVLSRHQLLEEIWDMGGDYVNDNTLTVYIKRLREKIEDDPQNPVLLRTVRGLGYRLEDSL